MGELLNALAVAGKSALGFQAVFFALLAIGLNIHFGYAGLLNFGQIAFALLGGFGIAISVSQWGLSFWVGVLVGLVAAVVLALLLGLPTLRLRADYLAIATIAAAEGLRLLFRSVSATPVTGGTRGLSAFNGDFIGLAPWDTSRQYPILGTRWSGGELWVTTVGWVLVALLCVLVWLLMRSPWGRVIKGIREDEAAIRSLGKNVYAYKMQALIIGGVLGPVVGAVILLFVIQFADTGLRALITNGVIPEGLLSATDVAQIRFVLVGLGLMLLLVFRPQGIFGDRREVMLDAR